MKLLFNGNKEYQFQQIEASFFQSCNHMQGCWMRAYTEGGMDDDGQQREYHEFNETVYTMDTFVKRWNEFMEKRMFNFDINTYYLEETNRIQFMDYAKWPKGNVDVHIHGNALIQQLGLSEFYTEDVRIPYMQTGISGVLFTAPKTYFMNVVKQYHFTASFQKKYIIDSEGIQRYIIGKYLNQTSDGNVVNGIMNYDCGPLTFDDILKFQVQVLDQNFQVIPRLPEFQIYFKTPQKAVQQQANLMTDKSVIQQIISDKNQIQNQAIRLEDI